MASINWPATLPAPLTDGYGEAPPDTTLRTAMDCGPDKVRRRCTAGPRLFSLRYRLTAAQVATLDTFYNTTSGSGSEPFNWTNPRTAAACEAMFLAAPAYGAVEHEGEVDIQLEVRP